MLPAEVDAPPVKVGCPLCGYVFTNDTACPFCHRRRCRCKVKTPQVPVTTQASMDPAVRVGYCPDCGQRTHLLLDVSRAVQIAQAAFLVRQRKAHLAGHRGRYTTTCPYCRAGNPIGQLNSGEPHR